MDRSEIPYDTRHQGVPSGASKLISMRFPKKIDFQAYGMFNANHAPTLHKDKLYLQTDRTKLPLEPLHPGAPNSASKMDSSTMVH